jgi:putative ABC transport system permease protein
MVNSLALRNLVHSKVRTGVAVAGVCFAVTLLFMQLGFLASVGSTANLVYDALDFDLLLTSPHYAVLTQAGTFSRRRLYQARAHPAVERAMPIYVCRQLWRNPHTRQRRAIVTLGVNPSDPAARVPELAQQLAALARPDTVLIDRRSRPELGPHRTGLITEIGTQNIEVAGRFTVRPGFEAGLIIVSDETFSRLLGGRPLADVNLGLIKLRPGQDAEQVARELREVLPEDVLVLTRPEVRTRERWYWILSTSTGVIFGCGVVIAVLFGVVITYQVLALEVNHRLSEYATLKALGFSDRSLSRVVLTQAGVFALASYAPGYLFAVAIYSVGEHVTGLPMGMTLGRALAVFLINLVLCCLSGLLALRILRRADPVELF